MCVSGACSKQKSRIKPEWGCAEVKILEKKRKISSYM